MSLTHFSKASSVPMNPGEGHCSAAGSVQLDLGGAGARGPRVRPLCCAGATERITGNQCVCGLSRNDPSALQSQQGTGDHGGKWE